MLQKDQLTSLALELLVENPSLIVLAQELSITTTNNESLNLTGQGSIQSNIPGSNRKYFFGHFIFVAMELDQLQTIHFLVEVSC